MTQPPALSRWLGSLASSLPELGPDDWAWLARFETGLVHALAAEPTVNDPIQRSAWLLDLRRHLAREHPEPACAEPAAVAARRTLTQFVCGFYDLDLRDAHGPGHGALILAAAPEPTRTRWRERLAAGDLVGIAATERHGGSRVQEITTTAVLRRDGMWVVSGEKCWVSRLTEASAFVVFFRDPDGHIAAAVVDADTNGLNRELLRPAGMGGWSWGILRLDQVAVDPARDVLGGTGTGIDLFRRHFAAFRPLVAATALGTAAGVHTTVAATLAARARIGLLPRVRDNALITLGETYARICAALTATIVASRLAARGHPEADLWARVGKAYAVDTAVAAVNDLAPLVGASGFQPTSGIAKARADLAALWYADGIHDSLYRSGGTSLLHEHVHDGERVLPIPRTARDHLDRAA